MSKDLSAKYYQNIKKDYKKSLVKNIELFMKNKKKKSDNMGVNNVETSLTIQSKG